MEKCKYYTPNVTCESKRLYEYLAEHECAGAVLGVRCPRDSGTDGKRNGICFTVRKMEREDWR